jgi:acyl-coenzyme A thioesterase PaaI-like protein
VNEIAIQDIYEEPVAHCYGCGRLNELGLQIKSYWDAGQQVCRCRLRPRPEHLSMPGFVYGGLIASVIDCHSMATAAAAIKAAEEAGDGVHGEDDENRSPLRFVTRSLQVDYLRPTPMGEELELIGWVEEMTQRKAVIKTELFAGGALRATGKVVAVKIPADMLLSRA